MAAPLSGRWPQLRGEDFEADHDGGRTRLHTLVNGRGMQVSFVDLGAKVQQIVVPDRDGVLDDVALGYGSIAGVVSGQPSLGAFIGRYANRIAEGRFTLDGIAHRLPTDGQGHALHGGDRGSRFRRFDVRRLDAASAELTLRYRPEDDGFPGTLHSRVVYRVTPRNEFSIAYEASSDEPTVVSMTSHVFFNLAGHGRVSPGTLGDHELAIAADRFTPIGPTQIPTGEIRAVAGTAMDFRRPARIAARLDRPGDEQLLHGRGFDHNWVLDKPAGRFGLAARLFEPLSGRVLEVFSSEPGLVFYGGNNLAGLEPRDVGKDGVRYLPRSALCLEPARFPDSPNHAHFPSSVLRPGELYRGEIRYAFTTDRAGIDYPAKTDIAG